MGASADEVRRIGADWVLATDEDNRPVGWIELARLDGTVDSEGLHRGGTVAALDGSTRAVLDAALSSPSGRGVVVDAEGRLLGTVTAAEVVEALEKR
jgi:osmoprotectant transport system ATP-binding protein